MWNVLSLGWAQLVRQGDLRRFLFIFDLFDWLLSLTLTCAADVVKALFIWIHESFLHVYFSIVLLVVVSMVAAVPLRVRGGNVSTGAPSPSFTSVSSGNREANIDGLMVCGKTADRPLKCFSDIKLSKFFLRSVSLDFFQTICLSNSNTSKSNEYFKNPKELSFECWLP